MASHGRIPPPLPLPHANVRKFKIALCQLMVTSDKERNINHARVRIEDAAAKGAKLVVLPEIWNCPLSLENLSKYAEDIDAEEAPSISMLSEVAAQQNITIIGGSIPEKTNGRLFNTCCVLGPDGKIKAKHRKLHLFDVDIIGDITFRESDILKAGGEPTVVDTDVGRIGIGICHDIRFPELAMLYRLRDVDLICYPGAFNLSTGQLLWEMMQRSRAADNQVISSSLPTDSLNSSSFWFMYASFLYMHYIEFSCLLQPAHLRESLIPCRTTLSGVILLLSGHLVTLLQQQGIKWQLSLARLTIP
ncbi:omega-amidase, chloroplastic-like isoform X1 [Typha angustifolia]|uniref:omega-amidase, chloroplastic-like isoform X1 n=1 Tax=Typha angustifolia TaxID=59011 RepID=UPI003C2FF86B